MPWLIRQRDNQYCVYKEGAGGEPTGDALGCHDSEAGAERQRRALEANVNEMVSGQFTDVMAITELRGTYPNVPIAPDVDYAALIAGDDDPMFLTLPIGEIDSTSLNKRFYSAEWITELERQTLAKKPVGLMGHLSKEERATAFPEEAIHWVGVLREGNKSWGKGYVPPGPVRDRIRRYKAQGKAIATSIDAFAEGKWDSAIGAYRMDPKTLRLSQIDLGAADRAGIPSLAAVPHVTREMEDDNNDSLRKNSAPDKEQPMSKEQLLQELRKTQVPPQRGWSPPQNNNGGDGDKGEMERIRELLGVDEKADLVAAITELRQAEQQRKQDAIKQHIKEMATPDPSRDPDEDMSIKIDPVRAVVIEMVEASEPKTIDEAEAMYKKIVTSGPITELLKDKVVQAMGPPQRTPLQPQHGKQNKYFAIPAKGKED